MITKCNSGGYTLNKRGDHQVIKNQNRVEKLMGKLKEEKTYCLARLGESQFTRQRNLTLEDHLKIIMNHRGRTLTMEIRNYSKTRRKQMTSKQGYSKKRLKINPEVFKYLNKEYVRMIYEKSETYMYGDYNY